MRLTQSLFDASELRLVCYVDDPLAALCGSDEDRQIMVTTMILVWAAIDFKLAFPKGQEGKQVTCIGGTLRNRGTRGPSNS